jgi:hypothetical protein
MPFLKQTPRTFTKTSVEVLIPDLEGVFGLFRSNAWIYIGYGDIRAELIRLLNGGNPEVSNARPTHFMAEARSDGASRAAELALELRPTVIQKVE